MKAMLIVLALAAPLAAVAGCAGTDRLPDCHGPWTPINPPQQAHAND